jgi:hypothetical protein
VNEEHDQRWKFDCQKMGNSLRDFSTPSPLRGVFPSNFGHMKGEYLQWVPVRGVCANVDDVRRIERYSEERGELGELGSLSLLPVMGLLVPALAIRIALFAEEMVVWAWRRADGARGRVRQPTHSGRGGGQKLQPKKRPPPAAPKRERGLAGICHKRRATHRKDKDQGGRRSPFGLSSHRLPHRPPISPLLTFLPATTPCTLTAVLGLFYQEVNHAGQSRWNSVCLPLCGSC